MEMFRRRKMAKIPRVSAIVTHSPSNTSLSPIIHPHHQGNQSVGNPNYLPEFGSASPFVDSSSSAFVGTPEEHLCVSSSLPVGTTMKKLLADEMKKESESGRRSPSIIANLMGLDWLPAQHNGSKQNKRLSDDYQNRCNSADFVRSSKENDGRSHRKHGKGKQKRADACLVDDRSNTETGSVTSRGATFRNDSDEDEVAFVRQKFIDVKRLSTDEKLRQSKEFHDALEVLDSNKDLLLKFLQEPNSLFTKHLHHLHGARESRFGCVEGLKSSNPSKGRGDVGYHSRCESSEKIDINHSRDGCNECHFNLHSKQSRHSLGSHKRNVSSEGKEDSPSIATRIVVLKPNLGKARNTARSVSSATPYSELDNEFHNGCSNKMQNGSEMMGKRSKHHDPDFRGIKSRESRELARDVTRKMKNRVAADSFNGSSYGYKGYSADESSSDMSENNSSYESDVTILGSTASFHKETRNKATASPHTESSISREAKMRLSRRWKMTHKSQEVGASVKGSTLAEMLAIPDVDIRQRKPDYVAVQDDRLRVFGRDGGTTESTTPLGISSRDGWKDGSVTNSSRFRSHSASSSQHGSPKSSKRHETITAERFLVRSKSMDCGRNKAFKRDFERRNGSFSGSIRSGNKEYQSTWEENLDDVNVPCSVKMVTNSLEGKASPDIKSVIMEMASCEHLPRNGVVDTEHKSTSKSLNSPDVLVHGSMEQSSTLTHDDRFDYDMSSVQQEPSSSYDVQNPSCSQFSVTQAKSPASSKESEQPSPVSVLEAPFVEEVSSGSECFERVSAELHGLRMQLQLLKQESEHSEAYDEGFIVISSDECEEESTELNYGKGLHSFDVSWESSYLLDVLTYSGLDEIDGDVFLETWHSPNCPISPWVFNNLEKKYSEWKPCLRSERKLLFDRINAEIIHVFSQHVDVGSWLNPLKNVSSQWWKDGLKTELQYLLKNHEKVAVGNMTDATILGEMQWFKLGDHLHVLVRDIEGLLIDELAAEFPSL
ncbi:hypothetical protein RND81_13G152800 [Saponaria officinalis]|uniref:Uncharacterized protein n=1 Tax=Saponaria officinalis TaxID=3572 RepID=A0AAW1H3N7_SAPOF